MGMPPPQIVGLGCDIVLASGVIVTIRFAGQGMQSPILGTKKEQPKVALKFLCHTLTDYRTIVEDFYKVVEFVEWLKEYYPEKIPLIVESK